MQSLKILSNYARNGVVILSTLKTRSYPMFLYLKSNLGQLTPALSAQGLEVLDDLKTLREPDKIRLFLKYHYGETVNLSNVRKEHRTVYNYLLGLGKPREVVEGMGFQVKYKSHTIDIENALGRLRDSEGNFPPLPQSIYNKVYYRAKKRGTDVKQFLKSLGS